MIAFIIMDLLGSTEASKTVRISITLYLWAKQYDISVLSSSAVEQFLPLDVSAISSLVLGLFLFRMVLLVQTKSPKRIKQQ
jgi:hypothetical protein